jgi:hypothetical protein
MTGEQKLTGFSKLGSKIVPFCKYKEHVKYKLPLFEDFSEIQYNFNKKREDMLFFLGPL